jgi:hypothetical protein
VTRPGVDIRPQPTAAERAAIEQALAALGLLQAAAGRQAPAAPLRPPAGRP